MANTPHDDKPADSDMFGTLIRQQADLTRHFMSAFIPGGQSGDAAGSSSLSQWQETAQRAGTMWLDLQRELMRGAGGDAGKVFADPGGWLGVMQGWLKPLGLAKPDAAPELAEEAIALWQAVLNAQSGTDMADLPRRDKRFADPRWRDNPVFALIHQTYLLLAERIMEMAETADPGDAARRDQMRFAARTMVDALSPALYPLSNPVVLARMLETNGESLKRGMEHLLADMKRGQLTHVDPNAFRVGENIAATPGKVVHQTPLYQLIQYTPTTDIVLEVPLVIFPPWINRFYILDLSPQKSFIRWCTDQGITVFVVSWKSADASMADIEWDDYIRAQIDAIDHVRERLKVPAVHTVGYCVAGTTLAATLAILARRGEADKVKSATFFTAQTDFEKAGEMRVFIDDQQLAVLDRLSAQGFLDGRYMAATFNLLRGNDLIWNYVVNHYLLGEDYPAFDLLHWNGDVTNLPARWHRSYLIDLYRDNKLVQPDALSADGTAIDLKRIESPCYIQAGREDHIAPAESVWEMTRHLRAPYEFVLAGSGHIAGVVNPPAAHKYQYWLNPGPKGSFAEFVEGAQEIKGSWWPHWLDWLKDHGTRTVSAKGKRVPGGRGDRTIEDAPGSYVKAR